MQEVETIIDETSNVIEAKAISGALLLQLAAEDAAKSWLFLPSSIGQRSIKATGVITFRFML